MIGKYQLQLGSDQFVSGMSSSDYSSDGALGLSCDQINPFVTPGIIRSLKSPTDISANVVGSILASCEDSNATFPNNRYMIDDKTNAANYYSYNGATITKVKTGTATGTTYIAGKSDMISFNGFFYASAPTVLNKWDGAATLTEAYQTFGDSSAHHPMILFNGLLYIGDGNTFSTLSTGGTYSTAISFNASPKEKIVALGIDPATGLMLISVQSIYDVSDTIPSLKAVYLWDGVSAKAARKILVDDLVTAFYNVEGQVYVGAGNTIGVWNGNGVTFLRKLQFAVFDNNYLPYKHHFSNTRNILHVVDGYKVLSFGASVAGKKGFYYTATTNGGSTQHLTAIFPSSSTTLATAFSPDGGTTFTVLNYDFNSTSAGVGSLYFNSIYFPRPIYVRRIRVITTGITTTSGIGSVCFFDEKTIQYQTQVVSFKVTAVDTSPKYVFDYDYTSAKVQAVQPRINFDTQGFGLARVIIYYDIAE